MILTKVLKSKIHRATVTDADVDYEGSVSIDADLMETARLHTYEMVHIWNVTSGSRLVTYAIPGERGSGTICVNGAAARLNSKGDTVIIASFVDVDEASLAKHRPILVHVDSGNRVTRAEAGTGRA